MTKNEGIYKYIHSISDCIKCHGEKKIGCGRWRGSVCVPVLRRDCDFVGMVRKGLTEKMTPEHYLKEVKEVTDGGSGRRAPLAERTSSKAPGKSEPDTLFGDATVLICDYKSDCKRSVTCSFLKY